MLSEGDFPVLVILERIPQYENCLWLARFLKLQLLSTIVLGSDGLGLIFARSWEGTQPRQLAQTGQTNRIFDTVWCHTHYIGGRAGPGG